MAHEECSPFMRSLNSATFLPTIFYHIRSAAGQPIGCVPSSTARTSNSSASYAPGTFYPTLAFLHQVLQKMARPRLCDICNSIITNLCPAKPREPDHHNSFRSLMDSVNEGCYVCVRISRQTSAHEFESSDLCATFPGDDSSWRLQFSLGLISGPEERKVSDFLLMGENG
jgi:hypothetical protein